MKHKFKVGDKGFLRDGESTYEVVLIDPTVKKPVVVRINHRRVNEPYITARHVGGSSLPDGTLSSCDLMPPEEFVWVNWYRDSNGNAWCVSHGQEEAATREYDNFAGVSTGIKRAVKMKVPSDE